MKPQNKTKIKALIYAKVIAETEAEYAEKRAELESKLSICRKYVAENNWELCQEFNDLNRGKDHTVPGLIEMMKKAVDNPYHILLVADPVDLSIRYRHGKNILLHFKERGIRVHELKYGKTLTDSYRTRLETIQDINRINAKVLNK